MRALGRAHEILAHAGWHPSDAHGTYSYLLREESWSKDMRWVTDACAEAVRAARQFEDSVDVTFGVLYGDYPEFLIDDQTGEIALIDWGTVALVWSPRSLSGWRDMWR